MGKYLKEHERYIIETMLRDRKSVREIAQRIGRHVNTVYGEIKRGTVEFLDTNLKPYKVYKADAGQRVHNERSHNKGIGLKIGNDHATAAYIESLVLEHRYSPYAVSVELRKAKRFTYLSYKTIYSYIHNGIFLNVSDSNLFYRVKKKNKKDNGRRPSYKKLGARTIEERPLETECRGIFGHWEMDTVYGGKGTSRECLLVLTERMTRREIIRKMADRTAESVLSEINSLERSLGYGNFKSTFKTITCDNGSEFSLFNGIEQSCLSHGTRTRLFFCHPFASSERGSNENANKLIRKYIPKGADISHYSRRYIRFIEKTINAYPRRLFGGLSSDAYSALNGIPDLTITGKRRKRKQKTV